MPTSALLTGQRIDIAGFEVRPDRGHEVHGVAAAETAMHALALPQHGVGDLRPSSWSAPRSLLDIGAEIDDDRRASASPPCPCRLMLDIGSVPGNRPSSSSTNRPLT